MIIEIKLNIFKIEDSLKIIFRDPILNFTKLESFENKLKNHIIDTKNITFDMDTIIAALRIAVLSR